MRREDETEGMRSRAVAARDDGLFFLPVILTKLLVRISILSVNRPLLLHGGRLFKAFRASCVRDPDQFHIGMTVIYVAKNGQTLGAGQPPILFVVLQLATWHLELFLPAFNVQNFLVNRF